MAEAKKVNKNLYSATDYHASLKVGDKMFYDDRTTVEIVKDNVGHFVKGESYPMHTTKADYLVKAGLAKKV
jgi:hypothetical protein